MARSKAPNGLFSLGRKIVSPASLIPRIGCIRVERDRSVHHLDPGIEIAVQKNRLRGPLAQRIRVILVDTERQS